MVLLALAVSFAISTAVFNATYHQQAEADARLTNGADVTVTEPPGTHVPPGAATTTNVISAATRETRTARATPLLIKPRNFSPQTENALGWGASSYQSPTGKPRTRRTLRRRANSWAMNAMMRTQQAIII